MMQRRDLTAIRICVIFLGIARCSQSSVCGPCSENQSLSESSGCSERDPTPTWRNTPSAAAPTPLGERGFCLAGDYDTLLSRLPLFNTSIKDQSKCVSYRDSDGIEKSFRPASNFLNYRHFQSSLSSPSSFAFRLMNVYPTLWDAYFDFRHRSSIVVDSMTRYEDLFATVTNIGSGKQSNIQTYYKRFQRSILDKRVSFYHLRAQLVHGEFEMKRPVVGGETHFSTPFLNYVKQNFLNADGEYENRTGATWDEKFFLWFGTHFARRGLFGGYIDLMITPWDIVCEGPVSSNLSSFAKCITVKLNKKFGLGCSRSPPIDEDEDAACAGLTFWMQNDQDVLAMVSGSDYDFQVAMSIGARYPIYKDTSDKPLMRGWLYSLYEAPGLVEATVEPICELFPNEAVALKLACKKNLLRYMRANEPLLRALGPDSLEDCVGGKRLVFDIGFNVLRDGCVSTTKPRGLCPAENREAANAAYGAKKQFSDAELPLLMFCVFYGVLRHQVFDP